MTTEVNETLSIAPPKCKTNTACRLPCGFVPTVQRSSGLLTGDPLVGAAASGCWRWTSPECSWAQKLSRLSGDAATNHRFELRRLWFWESRFCRHFGDRSKYCNAREPQLPLPWRRSRWNCDRPFSLLVEKALNSTDVAVVNSSDLSNSRASSWSLTLNWPVSTLTSQVISQKQTNPPTFLSTVWFQPHKSHSKVIIPLFKLTNTLSKF